MPEILSGFAIFAIVIVILAVILVGAGVKMVTQGAEWTVERFGRYTHTLRPGLALIIPLVDRIGSRINMRETVLDVPSQDVITQDNAVVRVDGVVFFQVVDAAKAAYEVTDLELAVLNLTMTNIRTVMGSMPLDSLLSERNAINARLLTVVDEATTPWGLKVTRIEIKDIAPPQNLIDSMARQMMAERDRRAVVTEAEGVKRSQILKAEGEKEATIRQAEGQKEAAIRESEGRREAAFRDAEARERSAEAEAKATEMVSVAIAAGNIQAINYFVAQRYIEALKALATAPNQKVLMLPVEAISVIGAIGGVAEIAKQAFGGDKR